MKKKIIIVIISIVFFGLMLLLFSNLMNSKRIKKEFSLLQATAYVGQDFDMYALDSVPKPLLNYVSSAVNKNYSYHRMVEVSYSGETRMNSRNGWDDCSGKCYFAQYQPGLLLVENITPFPLTWISNRMFYIDGKGNILFKTMSVLTTDNFKGPEVNQSALEKYISFAPLFPWIFLNRGIFTYVSNDSSNIITTISDKGIKINVVFKLENNRIVEMTTDDNYVIDNGVFKKGKWSVKYSGYKNMNGIDLPASIICSWINDGKPEEEVKYSINDYKYFSK